MAGITQNKQKPSFHCGNKNKRKKGITDTP